MTPPAISLGAEAARKAIHLGTAILPIGWALAVVDTQQVRIALTVAVVVALAVELLRFRGGRFAARFERAVGPLLRRHEHATVSGATWLALGMCAVVWLAPRSAAIAALWAASVGDATAALVGRGLQRLRGHAAGAKSLAGSAAAALVSAAGIAWLLATDVALALILGLVTALAERPSRPWDDNVRVTLAVAVAATLLGLR